MSKKPTFAVDAMLGTLAKKLRLLGYDSEYFSDIKDEDLILKAKRENRIILTRDKNLAKASEKLGIITIKISKENQVEQFIQINESVNLGKLEISVNSTRCTVCNGELEQIEKNKISTKEIPPKVRENNQNFWKCKKCLKFYWKGSHIEKIQTFVDELNEKL